MLSIIPLFLLGTCETASIGASKENNLRQLQDGPPPETSCSERAITDAIVAADEVYAFPSTGCSAGLGRGSSCEVRCKSSIKVSSPKPGKATCTSSGAVEIVKPTCNASEEDEAALIEKGVKCMGAYFPKCGDCDNDWCAASAEEEPCKITVVNSKRTCVLKAGPPPAGPPPAKIEESASLPKKAGGPPPAGPPPAKIEKSASLPKKAGGPPPAGPPPAKIDKSASLPKTAGGPPPAGPPPAKIEKSGAPPAAPLPAKIENSGPPPAKIAERAPPPKKAGSAPPPKKAGSGAPPAQIARLACPPPVIQRPECLCDHGPAVKGPSCTKTSIKCRRCTTPNYELNRRTGKCERTKMCVCQEGTPAEGDDCDEDGMEICMDCRKGWKLSDDNICEEITCSCFQGKGNPQGIAYLGTDFTISVVNGKREKKSPCDLETGGNSCIACTQPGWRLNNGKNNVCRPTPDNCEISVYQGCNFTGKVCHLSWNSNSWYPGSYNDKRDNFKYLPSYDPTQCDWMSSGVGSVKREPTTNGGQFKCFIRLRFLENFAQAQVSRQFRVLMQGVEEKCFKDGTKADKELATKVAAISREYDAKPIPPYIPPVRVVVFRRRWWQPHL